MLQIHSLWSIVREVNLVEMRAEIEQAARIIVVGAPGSERDGMVRLLRGETDSFGAIVEADFPTSRLQIPPVGPSDVFVVVGRPEGPTAEERAGYRLILDTEVPAILAITGRGIGSAGGTTSGSLHEFVAVLDVDLDEPENALEELAHALVGLPDGTGLALARRAPALRDTIANRLIRDTSIANAQFALLSSLPAWVPLLGTLAGSAADVLILTKNQLLLVFKLAGIYGRDLQHWRPLLLEMIPVIGGALVWRTVARNLVGLLPTPVSAVPKTAIAFVGTMTVGELAGRYYRDGLPIDPAGLQEIQERALQRLHLPSPTRDDSE